MIPRHLDRSMYFICIRIRVSPKYYQKKKNAKNNRFLIKAKQTTNLKSFYKGWQVEKFEIIFGTEPDLISYKFKEASHKKIFFGGKNGQILGNN